MHPVSQLLFGALTVRLPGALPTLHDPAANVPADGAAGLFSLALGAEQQSLSGESPQLQALGLPATTLEGGEEPAMLDAVTGEAMPLRPAPLTAADAAVTAPVLGGTGITADPATGNGMPPTPAQDGKPLPLPAVPAGAAGSANPLAPIAEAVSLERRAAVDGGQVANGVATPRPASEAMAAAHRAETAAAAATDRPEPLLRSSTQATASAPGADPASRGQQGTSLQAILRHADVAESGLHTAPHERQSADHGVRPGLSGNNLIRTNDTVQAAAADLPRPAGSEILTARQPTAEAAIMAAAADVGAARESAASAASRNSRTEPARGAETTSDRSAAPGAEGFEQQLRAAALRSVAPVTVVRDIGMIAERIEMLMHRRGDFANLNLNLGDLGEMQINVRMESKQAHINFVVQDAAVRETLEQQLPRLRTLLEQSGVDVGDMGMDLAEQSRDQSAGRERSSTPSAPAGVNGVEPVDEVVNVRRGGDGSHIIDAFA